MLKSGLYKAEHNGDIFHAYQYLMEVKVTEKSYVFKMIEKKGTMPTIKLNCCSAQKTNCDPKGQALPPFNACTAAM